jgi:hypothetical protein
MSQDEQYLKILSIFHFVVAGISALFACFPILHFVVGLGMLGTSLGLGIGEGAFPEAAISGFVGVFFTLIAGSMILLGWAFAVCEALAGWYLVKRKRYMYCLVMGGVECIFMPFGTVLGVFTIITLIKPSVKELFGVEEQDIG